MTAALEALDLVKHFPVATGLFGRASGLVRAVDGVSFAVGTGETLAIVGESGCGKSTIARLVLRLVEPTAGTLRLAGTDITALRADAMRAQRRRLQIIFQDPYGSLNPRLTVGAMLSEPLALHGVVPASEFRERVAHLLSLVGLPAAAAQRYPHEFSGGQRQRLAIARALAPEPEVIVCDEPVSALDVSIQAQILNLLAALQRRLGLAYVFISHDLAVVRHIATHVAVMYLGRFVETGPAPQVFARPRHPYTQALLAAVPAPFAGARREDALLGGDVPSALAPPPGCRFHPRCAHATERCARETPAMQPTGEGHSVACLYWQAIRQTGRGGVQSARHPALARLQSAFVARQVARQA